MVKNGSSYEYQYKIADHLGNTRVLFGDADGDGTAEIVQETHYYPFGLTLAGLGSSGGAPENKFLYNGKELEDEHNLYWYHYGARYYDPQLGKWHSIDPADEFYSPYSYGPNNPINGIDPDGTEWIEVGGEAVWVDVPGVTVYADGGSQVNSWNDWDVLSRVFPSFDNPYFGYNGNSDNPVLGSISWLIFGTSDYKRVLYDGEFFGNEALPNALSVILTAPIGGAEAGLARNTFKTAATRGASLFPKFSGKNTWKLAETNPWHYFLRSRGLQSSSKTAAEYWWWKQGIGYKAFNYTKYSRAFYFRNAYEVNDAASSFFLGTNPKTFWGMGGRVTREILK